MKDLKVTGRILPLSDAFKKRNPGLFAVGGVVSPERECNPRPALAGRSPIQKGGTAKLAIVVCLVAFRRRLLDDDNLTAGFKPLRDAIAATLRIDDGDKRIRFECHQIKTSGRQGTVVMVELQ